MSRLQPYSHTGPIDHTLPIDATKLRDKSVLVTGGANGMGEVIVRRFAAAGAFVTFADVNEERGRQVEGEVNEAAGGARVKFVRCDVRSWDDQVKVFEEAVVAGGGRGLDVVIANAGISRSSVDSLWKLDGALGGFPFSSFLNPANVPETNPDGVG
jgi:NAD(P)-dependent dehydrogenase (short-subunit alcohol dehydrogenase family)